MFMVPQCHGHGHALMVMFMAMLMSIFMLLPYAYRHGPAVDASAMHRYSMQLLGPWFRLGQGPGVHSPLCATGDMAWASQGEFRLPSVR